MDSEHGLTLVIIAHIYKYINPTFTWISVDNKTPKIKMIRPWHTRIWFNILISKQAVGYFVGNKNYTACKSFEMYMVQIILHYMPIKEGKHVNKCVLAYNSRFKICYNMIISSCMRYMYNWFTTVFTPEQHAQLEAISYNTINVVYRHNWSIQFYTNTEHS